MRHIFSWPAIIVSSCVITFLSVSPSSGHLPFPFIDKILHCLMYAWLSFLAVNTFLLKNKTRPYFFSFSYAFLLGLALEFTQLALPYRSFEAGDIFSNFLGSILGCLMRIV